MAWRGVPARRAPAWGEPDPNERLGQARAQAHCNLPGGHSSPLTRKRGLLRLLLLARPLDRSIILEISRSTQGRPISAAGIEGRIEPRAQLLAWMHLDPPYRPRGCHFGIHRGTALQNAS